MIPFNLTRFNGTTYSLDSKDGNFKYNIKFDEPVTDYADSNTLINKLL